MTTVPNHINHSTCGGGGSWSRPTILVSMVGGGGGRIPSSSASSPSMAWSRSLRTSSWFIWYVSSSCLSYRTQQSGLLLTYLTMTQQSGQLLTYLTMTTIRSINGLTDLLNLTMRLHSGLGLLIYLTMRLHSISTNGVMHQLNLNSGVISICRVSNLLYTNWFKQIKI